MSVGARTLEVGKGTRRARTAIASAALTLALLVGVLAGRATTPESTTAGKTGPAVYSFGHHGWGPQAHIGEMIRKRGPDPRR